MSGGTISYGSWDNCYVDGVDTDTITTGRHHVALVSTTDIAMTAFRFGLVNTSYMEGNVADIRPFSYTRTPGQILNEYTAMRKYFGV